MLLLLAQCILKSHLHSLRPPPPPPHCRAQRSAERSGAHRTVERGRTDGRTLSLHLSRTRCSRRQDADAGGRFTIDFRSLDSTRAAASRRHSSSRAESRVYCTVLYCVLSTLQLFPFSRQVCSVRASSALRSVVCLLEVHKSLVIPNLMSAS